MCAYGVCSGLHVRGMEVVCACMYVNERWWVFVWTYVLVFGDFFVLFI